MTDGSFRSGAHACVIAVLLVLAGTVVLVGPLAVHDADAAVRQDPPPEPTTEPVPDDPLDEQAPVAPTGDSGALVPPAPGDTADVTTTTVAVQGPTGASPERSESEKANQRVQIVVISLLVLAVVVAVATIVFWRRTSPSRVASAHNATVGGGSTEP